MIEFFRRTGSRPDRLGVLSGTFNPPTRAHMALARSALGQVDEVLFVLPRIFPHKVYEGAGFEDRIRLLQAAVNGEERFSIGSTERGLFVEIAEECREAYGPDTRLCFLCGRDAADRVVNWDYSRPGAFLEMLDAFELLVAGRGGAYVPPPEMRHRIHTLDVAEDPVSATEVRERICRGDAWEALVPPGVVPLARAIYSR